MSCCISLARVVGLLCSVGLYYIEQQQLAVATGVLQVVALLVQWGGESNQSASEKFLNKMPTQCVLPNGLEISQWAQGETDFLYTEIFESVSQSKTGTLALRAPCASPRELLVRSVRLHLRITPRPRPICCTALHRAGENNSYVSHGLVLGPGATVFDVGANIGMTTLFLAKNHLSGEGGDCGGASIVGGRSDSGSAAALSAMTASALRDELRSRGLKVSGRKAALVARLSEAFGDGDDDWLPLSRVFCFEPVPAIHRVLQCNADMISTRYSGEGGDAAELTGHVDVVALNIGLSDKPGTTTFDWHPNMSLWSTGDALFGESRLARWREDMPSSIAKKQSDGELPAWLACLPSAIKVWLGNKMLDAISLTVCRAPPPCLLCVRACVRACMLAPHPSDRFCSALPSHNATAPRAGCADPDHGDVEDNLASH